MFKTVGFLICVAIPLISCADVPEVLKEVAMKIHKICIDETGIDKSLIDNINHNQIWTDSQDFKCYLKCTFQTANLITPEGDIDIEGVVNFFPHDLKGVYEHYIRGCGSVRGVDLCDTAYKTMKCFHDAEPEKSFIV